MGSNFLHKGKGRVVGIRCRKGVLGQRGAFTRHKKGVCDGNDGLLRFLRERHSKPTGMPRPGHSAILF